MKISVFLRTELAGAIALGLAPLHPDATRSSPPSAETLFGDDTTCPTGSVQENSQKGKRTRNGR
jgi:hypothetical protein